MIDQKSTTTHRTRQMATQTSPEKGKQVKAEAPQAAKGRAKKEDAAYGLYFINEKGEESGRIPTTVTALRVKPASGAARTVALKDIPPAVLAQFAADGMRKKLNFFYKDVTKADVGKVQGLTDEFVSAAKNATIYVPKEGGGPGRSFDFDFWLDVLARTAEIRVKAGNPKAKLMTDKTRAEARAKLESMSPDQRKEKQKAWEGDKVFRNAAVQIRAERAKAKMSTVDVSGDYDASTDF